MTRCLLDALEAGERDLENLRQAALKAIGRETSPTTAAATEKV